MVKVIMHIVLIKLSSSYECQLLTTLFGFCSGEGCNDGECVLKHLQGTAYISIRKLYTRYVALAAVYDHINREIISPIRNCILLSELKI